MKVGMASPEPSFVLQGFNLQHLLRRLAEISFAYQRESGRPPRAWLVGTAAYIFLVDSGAWPDPDEPKTLLGCEVFVSKEIPEGAVIPAGDPHFDAFFSGPLGIRALFGKPVGPEPGERFYQGPDGIRA